MNPRSPGARYLRTLGLDANPLGAAVLLLFLATLVISVIVVWPMLRTHSEAPAAPSAQRDPKQAIDAFDDNLSHQVAQVDGRSLFAIPPRPNLVDTGPKATVYGGPALIAFVNGTAWFADGQKISPETPKGTSVELVRADPPWSIRVKWQNAEFDVELFKRVPVSSLNDTSKPSTNLWTPASGSSRNGGRPPAMGPFGPLPEIATRRNESNPLAPGAGAVPPPGGVLLTPPPPPPGEPQRAGGNGGNGGGGDTPQGGAPAPSPAPSPSEPSSNPDPAPAHPEPAPAPPPPNDPPSPPTEPSEP